MLRKFVAPEILFGNGARHQVGTYARQFRARRVFVVSDPGVAAAGWTAEAETDLAAAGLEWVTFTGVSPNPRSAEVAAGTALYRARHCDLIVAVGGGSPMDCAKAIGIEVSNQAPIIGFEGIDRIGVPVPPLLFIPTTAGTASDISQFAIINNEHERRKFAIISKSLVPDIALVDPETTITMDTHLTACTGLDVLSHALEAFVSTGAGPLTDGHALEAMRLVFDHLPRAVAAPDDMAARAGMMEASMKAGLAFSNAILGAVHALSHSLGGYLDLPHGACNAMLLEHVVAYNFPAAEERYRHVARVLGLDPAGSAAMVQQRLVDRIAAFRRTVGVATSLGDVGVGIGELGELARKAVVDPCLLTNPRPAKADDLAAVLREAL